MSTQFFNPSVALLMDSSYGSNLENYCKPRNKKTTVPLLPNERSKAELDARRKNTVLTRRLQSCLKDIARDKQTWLFRVHVEVCRFRRRAVDLYDRMNDLSNTREDDTKATTAGFRHQGGTHSSSNPVNDSRADLHRARRPVTCFGPRKTGHQERLKLAGGTAPTKRPRPKTNVSWNPSSQEIPHGTPLFKVRRNKVRNTASSSDDDDSDECSLSSGQSSASFVNTLEHIKKGNSPMKVLKPPQKIDASPPSHSTPGQRTNMQRIPSGRVGASGLKNGGSLRVTNAPRNGGRQGPQPFSPRVAKSEGQGQSRTGPRSTSAVAGRTLTRNQSKDAGCSLPEELAKRARARTALAGSRNYPVVAAAAGTSAEPASNFRDPEYLRLVIDLERDKYEISQMKVRTYLQNLKI